MKTILYVPILLILAGCNGATNVENSEKSNNQNSRTSDTGNHVKLNLQELSLTKSKAESGDLESIKRLMAHYGVDIDRNNQIEFRKWEKRFFELGGQDSSFEIGNTKRP